MWEFDILKLSSRPCVQSIEELEAFQNLYPAWVGVAKMLQQFFVEPTITQVFLSEDIRRYFRGIVIFPFRDSCFAWNTDVRFTLFNSLFCISICPHTSAVFRSRERSSGRQLRAARRILLQLTGLHQVAERRQHVWQERPSQLEGMISVVLNAHNAFSHLGRRKKSS